jgi:hypothetical protein
MADCVADQIVVLISQDEKKAETKAKRGRPKKEVIEPHLNSFGVFVADNLEELDHMLSLHRQIVGPAYRGNKRRGKSQLYADLLQFFMSLKKDGITLPRNKCLSRKVCQLGLGDILRRHGCTERNDVALAVNQNSCRERLAVKMNGIFTRVTEAL